MLKVAGWIISESAIDAWRKALPVLEPYHPLWAPRAKAAQTIATSLLTARPLSLENLAERADNGLKPWEEQVIQIEWPKMTPEKCGTLVCLLIRRINFNAKKETWYNFTPMTKMSPEDDQIFKMLEDDGLKLGEWVTVPDPFDRDWPFAKRYPGARYPPEHLKKLARLKRDKALT